MDEPDRPLTFPEYLEAKWLLQKGYDEAMTEARLAWIGLTDQERDNPETVRAYTRIKQELSFRYGEARAELEATARHLSEKGGR